MHKRQAGRDESNTTHSIKRKSSSDSVQRSNLRSKLPRLAIRRDDMRHDNQMYRPVAVRAYHQSSPSFPNMKRINEFRDLMDAPIPQHSSEHGMHSSPSGHSSNPPSPTTQRVHELHHLITSPLTSEELKLRESRSHSHDVSTGTYHGPPSPTSKRVHELHQLITSPPTSEELKQRGGKLHSPDVSTGSHNWLPLTTKHSSRSDPKLFTDDVIRRGSRGTAAIGYRTNRNSIALSAETFINKGRTNDHEVAIRMAKQKLSDKKAAARKTTQEWRELATNNPEKAGERKQKVPNNLSRDLYIPARAHQLRAHGKAKTFEEGKTIATAERDKLTADSNVRDARRRAKAALERPQ